MIIEYLEITWVDVAQVMSVPVVNDHEGPDKTHHTQHESSSPEQSRALSTRGFALIGPAPTKLRSHWSRAC